MKNFILTMFGTSAFLFSAGSGAEVRDLEASSFSVERGFSTDATPAAAYLALTKIAKWWDSQHTWSGSASNLRLDPKAGGCFCEKLANGGSVEHARVVFAQPGKLLRLNGAFGPLQEMPVIVVTTFKFTPEGHGTRVTMSYRAAGAFTMPAAQLAPVVDQVLGAQLERLKALADRQK